VREGRKTKATASKKADLGQLFVPFCRSEEKPAVVGLKGVGLGLSIAKRLAEVFGGALSVTSRGGRGKLLHVALCQPVLARGVPLLRPTVLAFVSFRSLHRLVDP